MMTMMRRERANQMSYVITYTFVFDMVIVMY